MSLEMEIAADFDALASEHGVPAAWKSISFTALMSRVREGQQIAIGGFVESPDMSLRALKSAFPNGALPEFGDLVTVGGVEYRVSKPSSHPRSPILLLTLTTANE